MSSITTYEANILVSNCNVGPLEAAHLKAVIDAIDAAQVISPTFRMLAGLKQLQANGFIGEQDVVLLKNALDAAAAGTPLASSGVTADRTREAMRRLKAVWPGSTVEGLAAVIFT